MSIEAIPGIGPKTAEYLKDRKVTTIKGLIKFGVKKLKLAPGFGETRASAVIEAAKKLSKNSTKPAKKQKSDKKPKIKKDKPKKDKSKKDKKDKKKSGKKDKDKKSGKKK